MPSTTVTSKGQVTIPKDIRDALGVKAGDRVLFLQRPDGRVVVEAETIDARSLRGMLKHRGEPVTIEQMEESIVEGASS